MNYFDPFNYFISFKSQTHTHYKTDPTIIPFYEEEMENWKEVK